MLAMSEELSIDKQYGKWLTEVKKKIQVAQIKTAVRINQELLDLYWELGKEIVEKQSMTSWGDSLIDQLSMDLSKAFPGVKGFSRANLFFMRKWFLFYRNAEKVSQLVRQIPWGHNREVIMKCADIEEATFYIQGTIQHNWSRAVLLMQINGSLYKRQGKAIHNFQETLPTLQADLARETLKNPYNFDFLTMGQEVQEKDIELALTGHIQKFLLELGHGFAYMGKQYHINVAGDDFYLDMLFYHTRLRCYIVVELKATEFQPEYTGKLNFYLNIVNAQLKHPNDQPSIGILLCKTPKKVIVEYALENISSPLGVAEYQIMNSIPEKLKGSLPSIEELEEQLITQVG